MDGYFYEQGPYHVVEPLPASGSPQLYLNPNRVRVARGATLERGGGGTANDAYQRSALNTFEDNSRNAKASAPLPSLLAALLAHVWAYTPPFLFALLYRIR